MRVLKTEDCFYVAGGNASDTNTGDFGDVGNMGETQGGSLAGGSYDDDAECRGGRWGAVRSFFSEAGRAIAYSGFYDGIKGLLSGNGAPGNPGTGNPMGDPGPSWGDNRSDR